MRGRNYTKIASHCLWTAPQRLLKVFQCISCRYSCTSFKVFQYILHIFHGIRIHSTRIPWFSIHILWYSTIFYHIQPTFHGIPLYSMVFHYIPWYSTIFRGIPLYSIVFRGIPDGIQMEVIPRTEFSGFADPSTKFHLPMRFSIWNLILGVNSDAEIKKGI